MITHVIESAEVVSPDIPVPIIIIIIIIVYSLNVYKCLIHTNNIRMHV